MAINSVSTNQMSANQQIKPTKPQEPTPPPGGNVENRQAPAEPSQPSGTSSSQGESNGVNYNAVRTFQLIIEDYDDVSTLNSEKRNELSSRMENAGLLTPGALISTTA